MERTERFSGARGVSREIISKSMLKQYFESGRGADAIEVLIEKKTPVSVKIPADAKVVQGAFVGCEDLVEVDYSETEVDLLTQIDRVKTLSVVAEEEEGQTIFTYNVEPIPALIFDEMPTFAPFAEAAEGVDISNGFYGIFTYDINSVTVNHLDILGDSYKSQWFSAKDNVYYRPFNFDAFEYLGVIWQPLATEPADWETVQERYFVIKNHKPVRLEPVAEGAEPLPFEVGKYFELIDTAHPSGIAVSSTDILEEEPDWWSDANNEGRLIYGVYEMVGEELQNVFHGIDENWEFVPVEFEADKYYIEAE